MLYTTPRGVQAQVDTAVSRSRKRFPDPEKQTPGKWPGVLDLFAEARGWFSRYA
jgi:hypothetical protein